MLIYRGNLPQHIVVQGMPTVPVIHNWRLDAGGDSDNPPTLGVYASDSPTLENEYPSNVGVCGHEPDVHCEECPKYHDCDVGNPCLTCTLMEYPCPWRVT